MAWDETKTNMTVSGDDLVLDEGAVYGSYETESLDIGELTWQDIKILCKVEENPAGTGDIQPPKISINISEDNIAWEGWELFAEGEYYCRYINVLIEVEGDPGQAQRPKITQFQIVAGGTDQLAAQPPVTSSVGALPGSPDLGDRHILTTDQSINTCVDADGPTWRKTWAKSGQTVYDVGAGEERTYTGAAWQSLPERDIQVDSLGVGVAATGTSGQAKIGTAADHTLIEADGTVTFVGAATVWNDANVGAMALSLPTASQPDEVNFIDEGGADTGITTWGFAVGEKVSGAIEIPHDYKEGSNITFHVHWMGNDAPTGTDYVKWQLEYTVAQTGQTLDTKTTITVEAAYDTQYEFILSSFPAITGTNFDIENQFLFTLSRIAAAGDAYTGDALIATVGLHYECDTTGSRQIGSK